MAVPTTDLRRCSRRGRGGRLPNGTPDDDGKVSLTALIPAFFGAVLIVLRAAGVQRQVPQARHAPRRDGRAARAVGGFMPLIRQYNKTGAFDPMQAVRDRGRVDDPDLRGVRRAVRELVHPGPEGAAGAKRSATCEHASRTCSDLRGLSLTLPARPAVTSSPSRPATS